jgi:hypothetical protein
MGGGYGGGYGGMGGGYGGMGGGYGGLGGGYGGMGNRGYGYSIPDEITRSTTAQTSQLLKNARAADDSNAFWTNHFAQENIDYAVIEDAVRRLGDEMRINKQLLNQNADQIVALVEAAIMSGNSRPWMYEALTLSLYLKGAPKAQVLRAALSAAEFCQDPIDLLNVGFVMRTALDMKQQAFPLYKQALENLPPKRELYAGTLRLANELFNEYKDEESLRWIGLAILSHEWEGVAGSKLSLEASDAMTMLHARMERLGRKEEAEQLAAEIRAAKIRDCVVTVEWTGDGGVDLMVCEPSNSLCWFKVPRTIAGGVLKNSFSTSGVKKISYICPRGFNGNYTLLLYKSWGNVSNDLVNVTVETNIIPGESTSKGVASRVVPEGIVIDFEVDSGRRTEPASEGELALVDRHMAEAQQNLNAMLWRLVDDATLGQAQEMRDTEGNPIVPAPQTMATPAPALNPVYNPTFVDYLPGPRFIGYRPEITVLDVGSTLTFEPTSFAVSPDRRYVLLRVEQQYNTLRSITDGEDVETY